MREAGGVGLLPALCRRRTACRRNVLRSRRNMTVSSLPGAVMARDIIGQSAWMRFPLTEPNVDTGTRRHFQMLCRTFFHFTTIYKNRQLELSMTRGRLSLQNERRALQHG